MGASVRAGNKVILTGQVSSIEAGVATFEERWSEKAKRLQEMM